jgi:hypothetical protein
VFVFQFLGIRSGFGALYGDVIIKHRCLQLRGLGGEFAVVMHKITGPEE